MIEEQTNAKALLGQIILSLPALICFGLVVRDMFQQDKKGLGIGCIILFFVLGIGPFIALVWGWMGNSSTKLMISSLENVVFSHALDMPVINFSLLNSSLLPSFLITEIGIVSTLS